MRVWGFLRGLFISIAVLGGLLIVLSFVLSQLERRGPDGVSGAASKLAGLMQIH